MTYYMETISSSGRVLFTGNGDHLIDNLMDHMPTHYRKSKCATLELDLIGALERFRPHALVVCLNNETREMLRIYRTLEEDARYSNMPVIVIGRDEDCDLFKRKVVVRNLAVFPRPIDITRFLSTLERGITAAMELEAEQRKAAEAKAPPVEEPAHKTESEPESKRKSAPSIFDDMNAPSHERASILVVDDDILMLNSIKAFLQELYEVTVVPSGKLALKFLAKKHADLVLLDYMMPEMDGPTVLKEIRENSPCSDIPVLFLTGVADKELVMRCLALNPSGYLLKPTDRDTLIERVTEILLGL